MAHGLQRLVVGDEPDQWRSAGFTVDGNECRLGKVVIELVGAKGRRGVHGWALAGVSANIEQIETLSAGEVEVEGTVVQGSLDKHTNAVFAIDHVVVETGDQARTVAAFEAAGLSERRSATADTPLGRRQQSFFWAGRVIVEVVGPLEQDPSAETQIWGLALVSSNLQTTAHVLGEHLDEPRDAVQPGRRIATMQTKQLDISVPIVVMSPHVAELL